MPVLVGTVQSMPLFVETLIVALKIYTRIAFCYLFRNFRNLGTLARKVLECTPTS